MAEKKSKKEKKYSTSYVKYFLCDTYWYVKLHICKCICKYNCVSKICQRLRAHPNPYKSVLVDRYQYMKFDGYQPKKTFLKFFEFFGFKPLVGSNGSSSLKYIYRCCCKMWLYKQFSERKIEMLAKKCWPMVEILGNKTEISANNRNYL